MTSGHHPHPLTLQATTRFQGIGLLPGKTTIFEKQFPFCWWRKAAKAKPGGGSHTPMGLNQPAASQAHKSATEENSKTLFGLSPGRKGKEMVKFRKYRQRCSECTWGQQYVQTIFCTYSLYSVLKCLTNRTRMHNSVSENILKFQLIFKRVASTVQKEKNWPKREEQA